MKKICLLLLVAAFTYVWSSCVQKKITTENTPVSNGHNSANSLDWSGTYAGILPCANCEGIETNLTLNKDRSYLMQTKYLGKDDKRIEQKGTFEWNEKGSGITLSGMQHGADQYLVNEGALVQLDKSGNRIEGALAERYILKKIGDSMITLKTDLLLKHQWQLIELRGKEISSASKIPYLQFEGSLKVSGFAGCNNFSGTYEAHDAKISFSKMTATRMACPELSLETDLLQVLETADNYTIAGDIFSLNKARVAPLARFKALPKTQ